jgi:hypothetical protein
MNYNNSILTLLVHMNLLTEEAAKFFSEELQNKIHSGRYQDNYAMNEDLINELEEQGKQFLVEPWMPYVRKLEKSNKALAEQVQGLKGIVARVEKLEKPLTTTK